MIIEGPSAVVVMEAKLGAPLGGDPMQLPQETVVAHTVANGREWRLLCVTPHRRMPMIQGFRASNGAIALDAPQPLSEAVASYFNSLVDIAAPGDWPEPDKVQRSIKWMSWQAVATSIDNASEHHSMRQPHSVALAQDVLRLLRARGYYIDPFGGFQRIPAVHLANRVPSLWTARNTVPPFRPNPRLGELVWPRLTWLEQRPNSGSHVGTFYSMVARPMTWSLRGWLAAGEATDVERSSK
jgi:hypothetical protein